MPHQRTTYFCYGILRTIRKIDSYCLFSFSDSSITRSNTFAFCKLSVGMHCVISFFFFVSAKLLSQLCPILWSLATLSVHLCPVLRHSYKTVRLRDNCILGFCISLIMDGYSISWQEINIQERFSLPVFPEIPPLSFVLQNYLVEQNNQRPTQSVPVFHISNSIHVYFFIFLLRAHLTYFKKILSTEATLYINP